MSAKKVVVTAPEAWPIENITPYRLNVKKHEADQVSRIAASLSRFGWRGSPIVVDKNGVIIAGHGRRLAALELGWKTVPVSVAADLSDDEVRALRLADNRAAISDTDTDMLRIELGEFDSAELLTGIFDAKEMDFVQADLGTMNMDAFVSDMGEVVADQRTTEVERAEKMAEQRVPLTKAFGFKDIEATAQIHITRLMGKAEASTGLKGSEALAIYAASL
jgi:hypothetical protein